MIRLNKEEKEILASFEKGEWKSIENLEQEIKRYKEYAKRTFKKDKRINIRVSQRDLVALQKKH